MLSVSAREAPGRPLGAPRSAVGAPRFICRRTSSPHLAGLLAPAEPREVLPERRLHLRGSGLAADHVKSARMQFFRLPAAANFKQRRFLSVPCWAFPALSATFRLCGPGLGSGTAPGTARNTPSQCSPSRPASGPHSRTATSLRSASNNLGSDPPVETRIPRIPRTATMTDVTETGVRTPFISFFCKIPVAHQMAFFGGSASSVRPRCSCFLFLHWQTIRQVPPPPAWCLVLAAELRACLPTRSLFGSHAACRHRLPACFSAPAASKAALLFSPVLLTMQHYLVL